MPYSWHFKQKFQLIIPHLREYKSPKKKWKLCVHCDYKQEPTLTSDRAVRLHLSHSFKPILFVYMSVTACTRDLHAWIVPNGHESWIFQQRKLHNVFLYTFSNHFLSFTSCWMLLLLCFCMYTSAHSSCMSWQKRSAYMHPLCADRGKMQHKEKIVKIDSRLPTL